jgi:hypothetical protein
MSSKVHIENVLFFTRARSVNRIYRRPYATIISLRPLHGAQSRDKKDDPVASKYISEVSVTSPNMTAQLEGDAMRKMGLKMNTVKAKYLFRNDPN